MTRNTHTPGPWSIKESENDGDMLISVDAENRHITLHTYELPEDMANAHLIAAAPELLEALEACVAYFSRMGGPKKEWDDAKSAIKKARKKARLV